MDVRILENLITVLNVPNLYNRALRGGDHVVEARIVTTARDRVLVCRGHLHS